MKFTVTYDEGEWFFEVFSADDEPSHIEAFEVDDLEDAIEEAAKLLEEIRANSDPFIDLFTEES